MLVDALGIILNFGCLTELAVTVVHYQHTSEGSKDEIGFWSAGPSEILASDFSFDKLSKIN